MKYFISIFIFTILVDSISAQWDERNAKEFFKRTNYLMAIDEYKNGLKLEPNNFDYNYK